MSLGVGIYQAAQRATENPRATEYRLFATVTRALMDCRDKSVAERNQALHWNRRVWLALQTDLVSDGNRFPDQLKAKLISIAIWVERHSAMVMRGEAKIDSLIDVNRSIMEGLAVVPAGGARSAA